MSKCKKCGKNVLFFMLSADGLCKGCEKIKEIVTSPELRSELIQAIRPQLTITHQMAVTTITIKQKVNVLLPFPSEAWLGYVSPSGGYINYGIFRVRGINPKTNRKNTRTYKETKEEYALAHAKIDGLIDPFEITVIPAPPPTEAQLAYAHDLGATIPCDACKVDLSAIISRITNDDEEPADSHLAKWANIYGLKFSRYHGKKAIMEMASQLPKSEYKEFLQMIR